MKRLIHSILLIVGLLFSGGCLTAVSTTHFEKQKKPSNTLSATNFRLRNCNTALGVSMRECSSAGVASNLRQLEAKQNNSLVSVPYDVSISTEFQRFSQHQPYKGLFILSLTVFPGWEGERHLYTLKSEVIGSEPSVLHGRLTETELTGWLFLPLGVADTFSLALFDSYPLLKHGDIDKKIADSLFSSLSKERYDAAVVAMTADARRRLMAGESLSATDKRLLGSADDKEATMAYAKHPGDLTQSRAALGKIDSADDLADIALHAKLPQIRKEAAERVSGLSGGRFAELVRQSQDSDVATIFLSNVSDDGLLLGIVKDDSLPAKVQSEALAKIAGERVLVDVAKTMEGTSPLGRTAVERLRTESALADVAGGAASAEVRLAAIRRIDNPAILLQSVLKDTDAGNRQAALSRIADQATLAKVVRESNDGEIRLAATKSILDKAVLGSVAETDSDARVRLEALSRVDDAAVLARIAATDSLEKIRLEALSRVDDPAVLGRIAETDSSEKVRATAVKKVSDSETLERIARNDPSSAIRLSAVSRINTPSVIFDIVANDPDGQVRAAALKKIGDAAALVRISRTNSDENIRNAALLRVDDAKLVSEKLKGPIPWLLATTVPIPGKKYCMGKFEVTQSQWDAVMGENPSCFKGADNPVDNVSWNDCQEFLEKLNALPAVRESNLKFRLPTDAEWEYACRAGATGKYCKLADGTEITEKLLGQVAWFDDNSSEKTHPVGQLTPNAFGLYDMHGNVWEWCQEEYGEVNSSAKGLSNEHDRVNRGGSGNFSAWGCGSSDRGWDSPDNRRDFLGFRLCADMHW